MKISALSSTIYAQLLLQQSVIPSSPSTRPLHTGGLPATHYHPLINSSNSGILTGSLEHYPDKSLTIDTIMKQSLDSPHYKHQPQPSTTHTPTTYRKKPYTQPCPTPLIVSPPGYQDTSKPSLPAPTLPSSNTSSSPPHPRDPPMRDNRHKIK